jgi:GNAT superfamily N-acetyltransferase
MGWECEERRFGYYRRNVKAAESVPRITARNLSEATVAAFVRDVREWAGGGEARVYVDDRYADAKLGAALVGTGLRRGDSEIYQANVGGVPKAPAVVGLALEDVRAENMREYVEARRRAFADSEEAPAPEVVETEIAVRLAEMEGRARYMIGRLEGEAAGIIGWYEGEDSLVFLLGTRMPYRNRGIARALLCHVTGMMYEAESRSVIINANEEGTPVQLYRRLGFTDEVYWRREYFLDPADSGGAPAHRVNPG